MKKTREITFMSLYIALYFALEYLAVTMPFLFFPSVQGGKVSISVIPLIIASYHLGFTKSLIVIFSGLMLRFTLIKPPYIIGVLQSFTDYFFAYGVYALSGKIKDLKIGSLSLAIGAIVTNVLRYLSHSLSGVLFFPNGDNPAAIIKGSLLYNIPYMLVTLIISFIVVTIIKPRIIEN